MARLRNPSAATEPPIFIPPTSSTPRTTTRSSPRKTKTVRESPSTRELRYSSQNAEDSFLVPKANAEISPVRKQRVLRPVASNSRLLRKLSDESLAATPDRKDRRRERGRARAGDGDVFGSFGGGAGGLYAKTLAKSVARKQRGRRLDIGVGIEMDMSTMSMREQDTVLDTEEDTVEGEEKSILCDEGEDKENIGEEVMGREDSDDEDEDEEPVVTVRRGQRGAQARRRIISSSEDEDSEEEEVVKLQLRTSSQKPVSEMPPPPPPLSSLRPPFRKGHSQISNWAQEVIDLTDSPEPPSSFVLPPPIKARTASFAASSRPTTSGSNDAGAMLHFSPTPTKQRSPRKAPPISRPTTPPARLSPSKLVSPSKKNPQIPHAPALRPSIDAFWDPEVVNDWNDKHSPSKPLLSPRKQKLFKQLEMQMEGIRLSDSESDASIPSPTTSPKKKQGRPQNPSPTKKSSKTTSDTSTPNVADARAQRKDFAARKHAIAEAFLTELDNTITNGHIATLSHSTGGIKLIWSRTLKTTAGRANWRREQIRLRTGPLPSDLKTEIRHHCSIELAEKVIDDEERLYNVLAHEYCHLTTFMISEVRNNPHGAEFKSWGARVTSAFRHSRGVEVTTKHSYKIEYKYVWECIACGYEFKRHSKSVDPVRHSCGRCKGKLVQTKPTPRGMGAGAKGKGADGNGGGEVKKSEYQVFVKENFARVKREMGERGEDTKMGRVMEVVAREYRAGKEGRGKVAVEVEVGVGVGEVESAFEGLKI
ncbi:hypothetical protein CC80DRAFT_593498 [Byssothecium circinans]|uniref:SprT-like domain-containing protein n=1 Tax=Byssothecium circinans TaxID=147558 RepID=A0A6A5TV57_9PLEO|nr:hypothetical protein CC80DRAFT_593498 [Byssothecium circinans]